MNTRDIAQAIRSGWRTQPAVIPLNLRELLERAQAAQVRMSVRNPNRLLLHQLASAIAELSQGRVLTPDPPDSQPGIRP